MPYRWLLGEPLYPDLLFTSRRSWQLTRHRGCWRNLLSRIIPGIERNVFRLAEDQGVVLKAPDALALFATAGPNSLFATSMSGLPRIELEYQQ